MRVTLPYLALVLSLGCTAPVGSESEPAEPDASEKNGPERTPGWAGNHIRCETIIDETSYEARYGYRGNLDAVGTFELVIDGETLVQSQYRAAQTHPNLPDGYRFWMTGCNAYLELEGQLIALETCVEWEQHLWGGRRYHEHCDACADALERSNGCP